jgi:hypothetical protein
MWSRATYYSRGLEAQPLATLIDTDELRIAQHDIGIAVNDGETLFQKRGITIVVVTLPFEVFTSGQLHNVIMVPGGAAVPVISIVTEPRVSSGVTPADLLSGIGRSIIRDNQFKIVETLRQNRFDSLCNKPLSIIDWHPDTHMRSVLIHHGFLISFRAMCRRG